MAADLVIGLLIGDGRWRRLVLVVLPFHAMAEQEQAAHRQRTGNPHGSRREGEGHLSNRLW